MRTPAKIRFRVALEIARDVGCALAVLSFAFLIAFESLKRAAEYFYPDFPH